MKAIDFFCGAGGLTRGLLDSGINVLSGIDNDIRLQKTYEHNNFPSKFKNASIETVDINALRRELGVTGDDVTLYAACTPCQPFSTLNRMKENDSRKNLLLAFANLVEVNPPNFILVENVPGLNTKYGKDVFDEFLRKIREVGFNYVYTAFLDAKNYGVPQVRKRFILIASRYGEVKPPEHTSKIATVEQFIAHYPEIEDGQTSATVHNHVSRKLMAHHKRILEAVPHDGGSRSAITDTSLLLRCHQEKPHVHKDVFGRMALKQPAPTLTCRCTDVYCGRFAHPTQDRGITLREAAALQSFRDDYEFFGTFCNIAHQIGNAVPVEFARRLGRAVIESANQL